MGISTKERALHQASAIPTNMSKLEQSLLKVGSL
ncbi:hypothetical protein V6Z12_D04G038900 [Gossypium hirsutum]